MDKADLKQDKKMIASAIHKHEKRMHQGMGMTKLARGGKTNEQMKAYGRNMAKLMNQKGSSRGG